MMYGLIYSATDLGSVGTLKDFPVQAAGKSIKVINQSEYEMDLFIGSMQIDAIPPYTYVIMPFKAGLVVHMNSAVASPYNQPYQYVAYVTIDELVPYQIGSTWQPDSTVSISSGQVTLQSAVTLAANQSVAVSSMPNTVLAANQHVVVDSIGQTVTTQGSHTISNPTTNPVQTHDNYSITQYNGGSMNAPAGSIAGYATTNETYSGSIPTSDASHVTVNVAQASSAGLTSGGVQFYIALQISSDGTNWQDAGDPVQTITTNGVVNLTISDSTWPSMLTNNYIRIKNYLYNTTSTTVNSVSCDATITVNVKG